MTKTQFFIAFITLVRKELSRCFRIWPQTLAAPVITSVLYFVIFGQVIGSRVGLQQGFAYIQFIAPGLILMATLTNAYINTSSSFFGSKFSRSIEEVLMSPMPNTLIVLGYALGGVFRGVFTGVLVTCVAIFFTRVHFAHWLLMIYTMLITAFLFALVGIINGVFARNFDDVSWIPSFVIAPLTYLGGVFYSISMLPPVWRFISHFDPIYYLIASFRFSVLGLKNDVTGYALLVSTLLVIVSFFVTVYFLTYSSRMRD